MYIYMCLQIYMIYDTMILNQWLYMYLPVFIVQVSMDIINTVTAKSPMIYVNLVAPLHKMYEHIIYIPFLTKTSSVSYILSKNLKGTLNKPISSNTRAFSVCCN